MHETPHESSDEVLYLCTLCATECGHAPPARRTHMYVYTRVLPHVCLHAHILTRVLAHVRLHTCDYTRVLAYVYLHTCTCT